MATKKEIQQIFDLLGIDLSVSSFDDRIKLQKIVYLTQKAFGVDLGFSFSWYIHGPYSSDLTRIMFDKEPGNQSKINESSKQKKLEKTKEFLKDYYDSPEKLELIASLHYFLNLAKNKMTTEKALKRFNELKPKFSEKEIHEYAKLIKPFV